MLNQVVLVGRVSNDLEVRLLENGSKMAFFNLAVQRSFKNMDGEYEADFFKITVWEGLASFIEGFLKKGIAVAVKGRLQNWIYETDNKKIQMIDIVGDKVTYISSPKQKNE